MFCGVRPFVNVLEKVTGATCSKYSVTVSVLVEEAIVYIIEEEVVVDC